MQISGNFAGIPKSEETKRKISNAKNGHLTSEETKRKISNANKRKDLSYQAAFPIPKKPGKK